MIKIISHVTKSQEKNNKKSAKHAENLSYLTSEPNLTEPEFLEDINPDTGKKRDWDGKKAKSQLLAESLRRISKKDISFIGKSKKVEDCGNWLEFALTENSFKLNRANFCKYRLCPMCSWRRSLKNYGIISKVMEQAKAEKYRFIFLTLTIKNCSGAELRNTIGEMLEGWKRFTNDRTFLKAIRGGFIRTLEVTRNDKNNTYHPHIHAILAVKNSYFKGRNYINQKHWAELWQQKMKTDYEPRIWVQTVRKKRSKKGETAERSAVKELSKYISKDTDYIIENDRKKTDEIVQVLDHAFSRRQLIAYGGRLRKIKKELGLNEENLVQINEDETEIDPELGKIIITYSWNIAFGRYVKQS